jgi:flagellar hook protein FlgE
MFDMNGQVNAIMNNQQQLGVYFGNIQNQFTPGYKAESINFSDMMGKAMGGPMAQMRSSGIIFTQGSIVKTNNATDLALNGNGFFVVSDGSRTHYTRNGQFAWRNGSLENPSGMKVMGYTLDELGNSLGQPVPITLTMDPNSKLYNGKYTGFHFDDAGKLYGDYTYIDNLTKQAVTTSTPLYQVCVASFANPSGLAKSGTTTFIATENSGAAVVGTSGQGALGQVCPQSLEMANVDFAQQAAAIGMAKQNYEANFAAFRAMDKLTEQAIGLVR